MGIHAHAQSTVKGMESSASPAKSKRLAGNWRCIVLLAVQIVWLMGYRTLIFIDLYMSKYNHDWYMSSLGNCSPCQVFSNRAVFR
jgi:hypothetical protein